MDIDGGNFGYAMEPAQPTASRILCCECGVPTEPNAAAMCMDCIKLKVDVTTGITREGTINHCRECERYMQPPNHWILAPNESRELMAICLKKLRGLNQVRLIDANFIWTEPHSRRLKLKLTVQKEAFTNTILQQAFQVEFVVNNTQCPDCARTYTPHIWRAVVQCRQKVLHKRTFLYLEQVILKNRAHLVTVNIKETKDGIDFFFAQRAHATKMIEFLSSVVPIRFKTSEELISEDFKSNTANYKFTYSTEIVPICKEDLVCLPKPVAKAHGSIAQLVLCIKVGPSLRFMDPLTLHTADMLPASYWRSPFPSLADLTELTEFIVADVDFLGPTNGKYALADVELIKSSDGSTHITRTHLGSLLNAGDTVMGYHLSVTNFNNEVFDTLKEETIPEIVLVKKTFPRKSRNRNWKLKSIGMQQAEDLKKQDVDRQEHDYEIFLRNLEEDPELRQGVNLYKSNTPKASANDAEMDEEDEVDENVPPISVDELLDDVESMRI
ncbi:ribosome export adaptor Nmd3 [Schizosaccharomyces osmophilus]|uniref:60S ribosomal export protein NMD3 n=1 Tax=Schizosaccharomyces osmophilus TaxID=2545709 RepID=A0AAE9W6P6_9SCHI|nr:ribosome export adaptor Nmd3 [Schizosaccharomyces osmophilus]WBW70603.1 ribosome export adaptor Nmd3 [Schizosaccharomyces osmophilus]